VAFVVLVLAAISAMVLPWMWQTAADAASREAFFDSLREKGALGAAILFGLVYLQVVVPILPAEVLELAAGVLFGTLGGGFLCLVALTLGTLTNFWLARLFGVHVLSRYVDGAKIDRLRERVSGRRGDSLVFLLYFIPGIPRDLLAYAAGIARYPLARFLLITTIARIPATFSSTYVGASVTRGDYRTAILIFVLIALVSIPGFFLGERWVMRREEERKKREAP